MDVMIAGVAAVFTPTTLSLILLGVVVGIIFGATPGLTAAMAVALFLPFSFGFQPVEGISLLLGLYVGGINGGLICSILLNIPGTPSSIATCFDGYPMAKRGEAGKALAIAIFVSLIGSVVSFVFLLFFSPIIARVALKFSPFEYFSVSVFSITLISSLTEKSVVKGLLSGLIGMAFAMVGAAPIDSYPRFTFGTDLLMAGFSLLPVLVGLYAITEVLASAENRQKISSDNVITSGFKRSLLGFTMPEFIQQIPNITRSSLIGLGIGILPGIGSGTSNILAYIAAKRQSKHPEKFGTGCIDGLVAPETANSATLGGNFVPLLAIGIPGDVVTALVLGGMVLHQVMPGPMLFRTNGAFIYSVFTALMLSAIIMFIVENAGVRFFVRLLAIPKHILLTIIVVLCAVGAFATNNRAFDVYAMTFFGIVGFTLIKLKFPLPPIILGFILAPIIELNMRRGLMLSQGSYLPFITKPISAAFLIIATVTFIYSIVREIMRGRAEKKKLQQE